jgi:hypothetical protein
VEGVAHGVQHVDTGQVQAVDRRADRHRPGPDHEPVVAQLAVDAGRVGDADLLGGQVDRVGGVVEQQLQPGRLQIGARAVGESTPVGHVTGQVVGQPTDREVRVGVGGQQTDLDGGVELAGAEPGADAGVAAPITSSRNPGTFLGPPVGW